MYAMTHEKRPGYWEAVAPLKIIHFSSSPKPWETAGPKGDLEILWWQLFIGI
jgi:glycogenin